MHRVLTAIGLVIVVGGCTDIISPPRVDPYEYRLFSTVEEVTYPIAFHWPRSELPVKIWISADDALRPALVRAIDIWEDAFLYGEFRAEIVNTEVEADIIVKNEVSPALLRVGEFRLGSIAPECRGATDFDADGRVGTLTLPFRVYVWSRIGPDGVGLDNCYEITVLHEIGHAMGLFVHSGNTDDLMFGDPTRNGLSERDRATIEAVYHLPTTVTPTR